MNTENKINAVQPAVTTTAVDPIMAASPIKVSSLSDSDALKLIADKLFLDGEELIFDDGNESSTQISQSDIITGKASPHRGYTRMRTEGWIGGNASPRYYAAKLHSLQDVQAILRSLNVAAILQDHSGYVIWLATQITNHRDFDAAQGEIERSLKPYQTMPWEWCDSPIPNTTTKLLYLNPDTRNRPLRQIASIDAADLFNEKILPPKWIVEQLIVEGMTILAGKPKIRKSWWCLNLALSVIAGSEVFGMYESHPCEVLYLALEDNKARLQQRLRLLCGVTPPRGLHFVTTDANFPRLDKGGIEQLEHKLKDNPQIRLIVIDTLQKVKPRGARNQNAYENDVDAMANLHRFALTHQVAVILVHHVRKGSAEDVFDDISGSLGLTGTADTNIVLHGKRNDVKAVMHMTGRAIEDQQLAMKFDNKSFSWFVEGNAAEVILSENRKLIREVVGEAEKPLLIKEIKFALEMKGHSLSEPNIKKTVGRMVSDEQLAKVGDNRYGIDIGYKPSNVPTGIRTSCTNQSPPLTNIPTRISSAFTVLGVRDVLPVSGVRGVLPPLTTPIKDTSDSMVSYSCPTIILNKTGVSATSKTGRTGKTPKTLLVQNANSTVCTSASVTASSTNATEPIDQPEADDPYSFKRTREEIAKYI